MLALRVIALALLALCGCTPKPAPPTFAATLVAKIAPPPGLFLYSVERNGLTSHLLGTIHLGFGFDEVLTPEARLAFQGAQVVVTETDVGDDASQRLMRAALLPDEQSLESMLDGASWQLLSARLAAQLPPEVLTRLRPWLPAVLLGITELTEALARERPSSGQHAMDLELMKRARESQKPLKHLETVDQQIAVFESISLEEQLHELKHALTQDSTEQSQALVRAFASGDEAALMRAVFDEEQLASAPGFYQAVLFDRNDRWMPMLEQAMSEQSLFVAVGVAHLLGEQGLLSQLKRRGYKIARIH